jgi:EmrB/QacA subfamily drug resistance transporter
LRPAHWEAALHSPPVYSADERRLTLISVLIVFLLSAMSQTVVATAMPRIVAELSGLHLYAWAVTAYLLASTVCVPIWGKLGDILGRKTVLLVGIGIYIAGSALSGLAGEIEQLPVLGGGMTQLIYFRGLQGLGGGALFTTAFAIIADLYPPRERAKFNGLFSSVFGVASLLGPLVGGFFTEHGSVTLFGHAIEGWRWCFYVNVPLALAAAIMISVKMPSLPRRGDGRIDYPGAVLIVTASVPLLLAVTWGGRDYPWASPMILGLLAVTVVSLALFVVVERAVRDPIMPLELFQSRTFSMGNLSTFVVAMAFMGLSSFLPLFLQVGQGVPATTSGLIMLALMGGMITSSTVVGHLVTRFGVFKPFMLGGGVVLAIGLTTLCFIAPTTPPLGVVWRLLVVGLGLGASQNLLGLAVQNAAPIHQIGVSTSSSQFVRQIGQTIGVALFGAVLTAGLSSELAKHPPPPSVAAGVSAGGGLQLEDLQRMAVERAASPQAAEARMQDPAAREADRIIGVSFAAALRHAMMFSLGLAVLGFVVMLFVPGARLRGGPKGSEPDAASA